MPNAAFTAVESAAPDDTPPVERRARRSTARRLRDAGVDEALASWPACLAAGWLMPLGLAWPGPPGAGVVALLGLAATAALACALIARQLGRMPTAARRRQHARRRACGVLLLAWTVLLCALPWLLPATPTAAAPPVALLALAPLLAALLAPLGPAVALLAAVPASQALAWASHGAAAAAIGSAGAAALLCGALALLGHRRWRRQRQAFSERGDALHALETALRAAHQADRDKTRFLATATHDLRQPVHALGLFAGALELRLLGTEQEPLVRNVIRSIEGLERSFNAMLDVSRLDAGAVEPNLQHFPLRDVFRRLHMQYAGQAEARGLGLRFSPGGKSVTSDPQLLERILGNLLQNALRYTERGGVVLVARSTRDHIHVEVWDTGIGIAPAELPRVFEEFYQCGRSTRGRTQGLGMGLAIVRRLARLLDHGLTVASHPGRGTMFRLAIARGGLPEIRDATAAADTRPMPVPQARAVLVIDDDEAIREGLRILLEEWGYAVAAVASAEAARHAAAGMELPPDLIISDLHLGEDADGIAAIAAVRRQCGYEVPAIVVTGDTTHEELQRAADAGHTVLVKPLQPRKLLGTVRGMLP
ncbi:hybrid sensor histidine kinase/response regulator [Pseudorhodoferax soli]|uniref:histidine kinase n=1 Tax=Pseudorhodoferax soli TaxID=545864 RepID=A0A368Y8Q7_9BURK|nr:hybrid sensor histidine kinase/response regulator [Pseudorhodoferax soli]RCW75726.1 signal transduction histidine kinase [Pseudorhodoferax soli]